MSTDARLPNCDAATIDIRKLRDYVLNPGHPEGRHKARVFHAALGIGASDSHWLAATILENLADATAVELESNTWGRTYRVDIAVTRQGRSAIVRTGWLSSGNTTRPTTCFILGGDGDETV